MTKPTAEQLAKFQELMNREILTDAVNDALKSADIDPNAVQWCFRIKTNKDLARPPVLLADGTRADALTVGQTLRIKSDTFKMHHIPVGASVIFEHNTQQQDMAYVTWYWTKHPAPLKQSVPFIDLEVL